MSLRSAQGGITATPDDNSTRRHWSCIAPWQTSLIRIDVRDLDVEALFTRGGREWVGHSLISDLPHLMYSRQLGDEEALKDLGKAAFQEILTKLEPAWEDIDFPGHSMRSLEQFNATVYISLRAAYKEEYEFERNTYRFEQVAYVNASRLPSYHWRDLEVLEAFWDGSTRVRLQNLHGHLQDETFGCILFKTRETPAEEAFRSYLEAFESFSEQVGSEKDYESYRWRTTRIRGLVRISDDETRVAGFLYRWTESWAKGMCLSQLTVEDLKDGQGLWIFRQCVQLIRQFVKHGYAITAEGNDILNKIGLTGSGFPFVRLPDLGTFERVSLDESSIDGPREKIVLNRERNGDGAALKVLSSFLLGKRSQNQDSAASPALELSRCRARNHLERLPRELLDEIIDYCLSRSRIHCTQAGFWSSTPLGTALWGASRFLREAAFSKFVQNNLVVDYRFLAAFLRRVAGVALDDYDRLLCAGEDDVERVYKPWTSLREITLLVNYNPDDPVVSSWRRNGASLRELLLRKSGEQEGLDTKVRIAFLRHAPKYPRNSILIESFRQFSTLACIEVSHAHEGNDFYGAGEKDLYDAIYRKDE